MPVLRNHNSFHKSFVVNLEKVETSLQRYEFVNAIFHAVQVKEYDFIYRHVVSKNLSKRQSANEESFHYSLENFQYVFCALYQQPTDNVKLYKAMHRFLENKAYVHRQLDIVITTCLHQDWAKFLELSQQVNNYFEPGTEQSSKFIQVILAVLFHHVSCGQLSLVACAGLIESLSIFEPRVELNLGRLICQSGIDLGLGGALWKLFESSQETLMYLDWPADADFVERFRLQHQLRFATHSFERVLLAERLSLLWKVSWQKVLVNSEMTNLAWLHVHPHRFKGRLFERLCKELNSPPEYLEAYTTTVLQELETVESLEVSLSVLQVLSFTWNRWSISEELRNQFHQTFDILLPQWAKSETFELDGHQNLQNVVNFFNIAVYLGNVQVAYRMVTIISSFPNRDIFPLLFLSDQESDGEFWVAYRTFIQAIDSELRDDIVKRFWFDEELTEEMRCVALNRLLTCYFDETEQYAWAEKYVEQIANAFQQLNRRNYFVLSLYGLDKNRAVALRNFDLNTDYLYCTTKYSNQMYLVDELGLMDVAQQYWEGLFRGTIHDLRSAEFALLYSFVEHCIENDDLGFIDRLIERIFLAKPIVSHELTSFVKAVGETPNHDLREWFLNRLYRSWPEMLLGIKEMIVEVMTPEMLADGRIRECTQTLVYKYPELLWKVSHIAPHQSFSTLMETLINVHVDGEYRYALSLIEHALWTDTRELVTKFNTPKLSWSFWNLEAMRCSTMEDFDLLDELLETVYMVSDEVSYDGISHLQQTLPKYPGHSILNSLLRFLQGQNQPELILELLPVYVYWESWEPFFTWLTYVLEHRNNLTIDEGYHPLFTALRNILTPKTLSVFLERMETIDSYRLELIQEFYLFCEKDGCTDLVDVLFKHAGTWLQVFALEECSISRRESILDPLLQNAQQIIEIEDAYSIQKLIVLLTDIPTSKLKLYAQHYPTSKIKHYLQVRMKIEDIIESQENVPDAFHEIFSLEELEDQLHHNPIAELLYKTELLSLVVLQTGSIKRGTASGVLTEQIMEGLNAYDMKSTLLIAAKYLPILDRLGLPAKQLLNQLVDAVYEMPRVDRVPLLGLLSKCALELSDVNAALSFVYDANQIYTQNQVERIWDHLMGDAAVPISYLDIVHQIVLDWSTDNLPSHSILQKIAAFDTPRINLWVVKKLCQLDVMDLFRFFCAELTVDEQFGLYVQQWSYVGKFNQSTQHLLVLANEVPLRSIVYTIQNVPEMTDSLLPILNRRQYSEAIDVALPDLLWSKSVRDKTKNLLSIIMTSQLSKLDMRIVLYVFGYTCWLSKQDKDIEDTLDFSKIFDFA